MSVTIELNNDELLKQAVEASSRSSDEDVIEEALELFVKIRRQAALRELRGMGGWEGDLHESRLNRFED